MNATTNDVVNQSRKMPKVSRRKIEWSTTLFDVKGVPCLAKVLLNYC